MERTKLNGNVQRRRILPTLDRHDQGVEPSIILKYLVQSLNMPSTNKLIHPSSHIPATECSHVCLVLLYDLCAHRTFRVDDTILRSQSCYAKIPMFGPKDVAEHVTDCTISFPF